MDHEGNTDLFVVQDCAVKVFAVVFELLPVIGCDYDNGPGIGLVEIAQYCAAVSLSYRPKCIGFQFYASEDVLAFRVTPFQPLHIQQDTVPGSTQVLRKNKSPLNISVGLPVLAVHRE